jgi:hypothetical protein
MMAILGAAQCQQHQSLDESLYPIQRPQKYRSQTKTMLPPAAQEIANVSIAHP